MAESPFTDNDLKAALRKQLRQELKSRLVDQEKKIKQSPALLLRKWAIAAIIGLVVVVGIGYLFLFPSSSTPASGVALYQEFFAPYPNELYPINLGAEDTTQEALALQLYERKIYVAAIDGIRQIPVSRRTSDIRFYEANALLALDSLTEAQEILIQLQRQPDAAYRLQAEWYLALSYLAQSNPSQAVPLLEEIAMNSGHPYQSEASSVLSKLIPEI